MANAQEVTSEVTLIAALSAQILEAIPETAEVGALAGPLAVLVSNAIAAYQKASGTPVTTDSLALLYPSTTPLAAPKS